MREDDDNIRLYTPVFWRIIILVAVITAVPVVLWTITAFMRTYVAQPKVPTFKPIATASSTVTPNDITASVTPRTDASAPPAVDEARAPNAHSASADPRGPFGGDRAADNDSAAPKGDARMASANPQALPGRAAAPPAPASPWPEPAAQSAVQPQPAAGDSILDDLPSGRPITGRIPLPPHRPHVFATTAQATAPTAVPMPRARPTAAPEAKPFNADDAPFSRGRQDVQ